MSSTALQKISNVPLSSLDDIRTVGEVFAKSGYFKDASDISKAIVKIIAGAELGFGPMASMTGIYIVKERVTLSANLMAAAIKRSGRYSFKVLRLDNDGCAIQFLEMGQVIGESVFTMADATKANLSGGDNWKKYPRNMCYARAMSNGAKWFCADVFGGPVYTPDELGEPINAETGEVLQPQPAKLLQMPQQSQPEQVIEAEIQTAKIAETTVEAIRALARRKGKDADEALAKRELPRLEDLTPEDAARFSAALETLPDVEVAPVEAQQPHGTATQQRIRLFWNELKMSTREGVQDFYKYLEERNLEFNHEISSELDIPEGLGKGYASNLGDLCAQRQAGLEGKKDDPIM